MPQPIIADTQTQQPEDSEDKFSWCNPCTWPWARIFCMIGRTLIVLLAIAGIIFVITLWRACATNRSDQLKKATRLGFHYILRTRVAVGPNNKILTEYGEFKTAYEAKFYTLGDEPSSWFVIMHGVERRLVYRRSIATNNKDLVAVSKSTWLTDTSKLLGSNDINTLPSPDNNRIPPDLYAY
jgi:hypothetical protein